ncbi:uncharacterized protein LOC135930099 [Gordionus sp. m RMFG-2023]|uniref:uncharacterized protein LOC135930099 n=1 Tax=Gordionus sp. m RMFG-2023 TaxID=3053472 RepID=UPI0031FC5DA3
MGYQDQVFKSLIDSIISTSFKVGDSELYVINQELMPTGPKVSIVSEVRRTGDGLTYQFNQSEQTQKSYYSKFEAHEDILTDNSNTKIPDISRQRPSTIVPLSVTIDGQTYSQCSVDQKLLLGCLDSESTCLVKETSQSQGFSNNGEAECVCQEGFSQRLWSAPKNEADILGVRGAIGDKKKCYKYQRVTTGFRLSLSDIYKYDLSVKSTEFINPNNIFSKTISDQITKMFLKSPLRRYFLKIKIESVVPYQNPLALVASGSVIFSFTIRCSLYLDIELQATEEEIHNRFSQEFALNKENYDALGWKIQVFPYSQTNEERYLSPPSPNTRNPQKPNIVIKPAPVVFVSQKNSPKVSLSDYDEDTVLTQKQGFINDTGFLKVSFGKRPSTNATCKLGTSIGCGFNEECILNTGQTICRCLFGFARKADSIECIAQKTLDVQLRIDSIRNISIVEIYNKSLLDRTDSKFVTFMMEELNAFLSDSEHAIYIIEARFNNLAKINYEKDLKTQHVLVNFTLVIKNSFEGSFQEMISSLISRMRLLKFRLDNSNNRANIAPFKDMEQVIKEDSSVNVVASETYEINLDSHGLACSYEESLTCAVNKELCKLIKGKPVCLCRHGFSRTYEDITSGPCIPSFYYFIVIRVIRYGENVLHYEDLRNTVDKDQIMSQLLSASKKAFDASVNSSDLSKYFLNSRFNGIINPVIIDSRWKNMGLGLNFTLVLSRVYKGSTRDIAKSLSRVIIENDYKLPSTQFYVSPPIKRIKSQPEIEHGNVKKIDLKNLMDLYSSSDKDMVEYLTKSGIDYALYEIKVSDLSFENLQIFTGPENLENFKRKLDAAFKRSNVSSHYLAFTIPVKINDTVSNVNSLHSLVQEDKYFKLSLYFKRGAPADVIESINSLLKDVIYQSLLTHYQTQTLTSTQATSSFMKTHLSYGYSYALELDVSSLNELQNSENDFHSQNEIKKKFAKSLESAIKEIFVKRPLINGFYSGVDVNSVLFLRPTQHLASSFVVNFTVYITQALNQSSADEVSTNILTEILRSNYTLPSEDSDKGGIQLKIRPESLTHDNIGTISFIVLISVLKYDNKPILYGEYFTNKSTLGYQNFEENFIKGIKGVLKDNDMGKYLASIGINSISPTIKEGSINLGVIVNFTLNFIPIFKVSDLETKFMLSKLIAKRNYQLANTKLYINPVPIPNLAQKMCLIKSSRGTCNANLTRWYFDYTTKRCKDFNYSGCNGNLNSFLSITQCQSTCMFYIPPCELAPDPGLCSEKQIRFYYDSSISGCRNFVYTGCGGNLNNFKDWKECRDQCATSKLERPIFDRNTKDVKSTTQAIPIASIYIIQNKVTPKVFPNLRTAASSDISLFKKNTKPTSRAVTVTYVLGNYEKDVEKDKVNNVGSYDEYYIIDKNRENKVKHIINKNRETTIVEKNVERHFDKLDAKSLSGNENDDTRTFYREYRFNFSKPRVSSLTPPIKPVISSKYEEKDDWISNHGDIFNRSSSWLELNRVKDDRHASIYYRDSNQQTNKTRVIITPLKSFKVSITIPPTVRKEYKAQNNHDEDSNSDLFLSISSEQHDDKNDLNNYEFTGFQQDFKAETVPIISATHSSEDRENALLTKLVVIKAEPVKKESRFNHNADQNFGKIISKQKTSKKKGQAFLETYQDKKDSLIHYSKPVGEHVVSLEFKSSFITDRRKNNHENNETNRGAQCSNLFLTNATCDEISRCYPSSIFVEYCKCHTKGLKRKASGYECVAVSPFILYNAPKNNLNSTYNSSIKENRRIKSKTQTKLKNIIEKNSILTHTQSVKFNTRSSSQGIYGHHGNNNGTTPFRVPYNRIIRITSSPVEYLVGQENIKELESRDNERNEDALRSQGMYYNKVESKKDFAIKIQQPRSNYRPSTSYDVNDQGLNRQKTAIISTTGSSTTPAETPRKVKLSQEKDSPLFRILNKYNEKKYSMIKSYGTYTTPGKSSPSIDLECPKHFIIHQNVRRNNLVPLRYTSVLGDKRSITYQNLVKLSEKGLSTAFLSSKFSNHFLRARVEEFSKSRHDESIVIKAVICVDNNFEDSRKNILAALQESITKYYNNSLGQTSLFIDDVQNPVVPIAYIYNQPLTNENGATMIWKRDSSSNFTAKYIKSVQAKLNSSFAESSIIKPYFITAKVDIYQQPPGEVDDKNYDQQSKFRQNQNLISDVYGNQIIPNLKDGQVYLNVTLYLWSNYTGERKEIVDKLRLALNLIDRDLMNIKVKQEKAENNSHARTPDYENYVTKKLIEHTINFAITTRSTIGERNNSSHADESFRKIFAPISHLNYRLSFLEQEKTSKAILTQNLLFEVLLDAKDLNITDRKAYLPKIKEHEYDLKANFEDALKSSIETLGLTDYHLGTTINVVLDPDQLSYLRVSESTSALAAPNKLPLLFEVTLKWDNSVALNNHNNGKFGGSFSESDEDATEKVICHIRNQFNHLFSSNGYKMGGSNGYVFQLSPRPLGSLAYNLHLEVSIDSRTFKPIFFNDGILQPQTTEFNKIKQLLEDGLYQLYYPSSINPKYSIDEKDYCFIKDTEVSGAIIYSHYLGSQLNQVKIRKKIDSDSDDFTLILNMTFYVNATFGLDLETIIKDLQERAITNNRFLGYGDIKLVTFSSDKLAWDVTERYTDSVTPGYRPRNEQSQAEKSSPEQQNSLVLPVVSISGRPIQYSLLYSNPNSNEFKSLDQEFRRYIDEIFLTSPLRGIYQGVHINNLKPLSVIYENSGLENGLLINYTVVLYREPTRPGKFDQSSSVTVRNLTSIIENRFHQGNDNRDNLKITENSDDLFVSKPLPNRQISTECISSGKLCRVPQKELKLRRYELENFLDAKNSAAQSDIQSTFASVLNYSPLKMELTIFRLGNSQTPLIWDKEYENTQSASYKMLIGETKKLLDSILRKAPELTGVYSNLDIEKITPYQDTDSGKTYVTFHLTVYNVIGDNQDGISTYYYNFTNNRPAITNTWQSRPNYVAAGNEDELEKTETSLKTLYQILYRNLVSNGASNDDFRAALTSRTPMYYRNIQNLDSYIFPYPYTATPATINAEGTVYNLYQEDNNPEGGGNVSFSIENKLKIEVDDPTLDYLKKVVPKDGRSRYLTPFNSLNSSRTKSLFHYFVTNDPYSGTRNIFASKLPSDNSLINAGNTISEEQPFLSRPIQRSNPTLIEREERDHSRRQEYLVLLNILRRNEDALIYYPDFVEQDSSLYVYVEEYSKIGLENVIKASELAQYFLSSKVNSILDPEIIGLPTPVKGIVVNFTLTFNNEYKGTQENIFDILSQKIIDFNYNIIGTNLYVNPAPSKVEYELEFNFEEIGQDHSIREFNRLSHEEFTKLLKKGVKDVLSRTPLSSYFVDGDIKQIKYNKQGNVTFALDIYLKPDYPGSKGDLYSTIYSGFESIPIKLGENISLKLLRFRKPIEMNIGVVNKDGQILKFMAVYKDKNSTEYQDFKDRFLKGIKNVLSYTKMAHMIKDVEMIRLAPMINHNPPATIGRYHLDSQLSNNEEEQDVKEFIDEKRDTVGIMVGFKTSIKGSEKCDKDCQRSLKREIIEVIENNHNEIGRSGLYIQPSVDIQSTIGVDEHALDVTPTPNSLTSISVSRPEDRTSTPTFDSKTRNVQRTRTEASLICRERETLTGCGTNQYCEINTSSRYAVCKCFPGYIKLDGNCIDKRHKNISSYSKHNYYRDYLTTPLITTVKPSASFPSLSSKSISLITAKYDTDVVTKPVSSLCQERNDTYNGCGINARCVYSVLINEYYCECVQKSIKNDLNDCISMESRITSSNIYLSFRPRATSTRYSTTSKLHDQDLINNRGHFKTNGIITNHTLASTLQRNSYQQAFQKEFQTNSYVFADYQDPAALTTTSNLISDRHRENLNLVTSNHNFGTQSLYRIPFNLTTVHIRPRLTYKARVSYSLPNFANTPLNIMETLTNSAINDQEDNNLISTSNRYYNNPTNSIDSTDVNFYSTTNDDNIRENVKNSDETKSAQRSSPTIFSSSSFKDNNVRVNTPRSNNYVDNSYVFEGNSTTPDTPPLVDPIFENNKIQIFDKLVKTITYRLTHLANVTFKEAKNHRDRNSNDLNNISRCIDDLSSASGCPKGKMCVKRHEAKVECVCVDGYIFDPSNPASCIGLDLNNFDN